MGFPRQEYWSGLPFPSPGDLPNPGLKPGSLALQLDSLPTELPGKPTKGYPQLNTCTKQGLSDSVIILERFCQTIGCNRIGGLFLMLEKIRKEKRRT